MSHHKRSTDSTIMDVAAENEQSGKKNGSTHQKSINQSGNSNGSGVGRRRNRPPMDIEPKYTEYWSQESIDQGIKEGRVAFGAFHVLAHRRNIGFVRLNNGERDVFVEGLEARNRAMDGDYVAVELGPEVDASDAEEGRAPGNSSPARKLFLAAPDLVAEANDPLWAPTEPTEKQPEDLGSRNGTEPTDTASRKKQRTGRVVAVLAVNSGTTSSSEREFSSTIIGKLQAACPERLLQRGHHLPSTETFAYLVPADTRVPRIRIPRGDLPYEFTQDPLTHGLRFLYSGKISSWPSNAKEPTGVLLGRLGQAGEIGTETQALLMAHGVDHGEFPQDALDCLSKFLPPRESNFNKPGEAWWTIPKEEFAKRKDLRDTLIFTVDPYTAKDIDDALHCTPLPNGEFEVGVHIADVSFFVERGSALDVEAHRRSTSVYLVQKVIPMLPALLSEELCSLNPSVDRLAFSCIWRMNAQGELIPTHPPWFGRTIIRSACKLHYGLAQKIIDEGPETEWNEPGRTPEEGKWTKAEVCESLRNLQKIGLERRRLRFDPNRGGALEMQTAKMFFSLDPETGNPTGVVRYPLYDTNRLVEEFMLLANFLVAQRLIQGDRENAFLRHHPPPDAKEMQKMVETLQRSCGVSLFENNKISPSAIHEALKTLKRKEGRGDKLDDVDEETRSTTLHIVASEMLKKPMKNAQYFVASDLEDFMWRHWALNIKYYTHFTSPIRRYADVCVHRQLSAVLAPVPQSALATSEKAYLRTAAERCNEKKDASRQAQEASDEVYLNLLLRDAVQKKTPFTTQSVVIDLGPRSFTVLLPELGITKRVHVNDDFRWAVVAVETLEGQSALASPTIGNGAALEHGMHMRDDSHKHDDEDPGKGSKRKSGQGRGAGSNAKNKNKDASEGTVILIRAKDPKSNLIVDIKVLSEFCVALLPKASKENSKSMDFKLVPAEGACILGVPVPPSAATKPKSRYPVHRQPTQELLQNNADGYQAPKYRPRPKKSAEVVSGAQHLRTHEDGQPQSQRGRRHENAIPGQAPVEHRAQQPKEAPLPSGGDQHVASPEEGPRSKPRGRPSIANAEDVQSASAFHRLHPEVAERPHRSHHRRNGGDMDAQHRSRPQHSSSRGGKEDFQEREGSVTDSRQLHRQHTHKAAAKQSYTPAQSSRVGGDLSIGHVRHQHQRHPKSVTDNSVAAQSNASEPIHHQRNYAQKIKVEEVADGEAEPKGSIRRKKHSTGQEVKRTDDDQ